MKAVVITAFATQPTVTDLPVPEPGPGELLVRLHAAGLNPFDWKVADGALANAVPHAFPLVMGSDGAGVVAKVGPGVTRFRPGDRVYGQFMRVEQGRARTRSTRSPTRPATSPSSRTRCPSRWPRHYPPRASPRTRLSRPPASAPATRC